MKQTTTLIITLLVTFSLAQAQQKPISKLVFEEGQTYYVNDDVNTILVDTLVMQDNSTVYFKPEEDSKLIAKVAYIGKNCVISAMGITGQDGGNLDLKLHFETLGSLVIDTRGADGIPGIDGNDKTFSQDNSQVIRNEAGQIVSISPGNITTLDMPGTLGSRGSNGGNGGDVILTYSTNGFAPNFNRKDAPSSIIILQAEGKKGTNGKNGKHATMPNKKAKHPVEQTKSKPGTLKLFKVENGKKAGS